MGTISSNLGVHPDAVKRAIYADRFGPNKKTRPCDKVLDPYEDFLIEKIREYPNLKAPRLTQMIAARGYRGSFYPVRRFLAERRRKAKRSFQELMFLPGEMAQVDWASFGKIEVEGGIRRLECFVMVLAYSRLIFAKVFHDQSMGRVLEGHVEAFKYFGGVPRVLLYDNMKTAVTENFGRTVRFNESLTHLGSHYHFDLRACNPRASWEKGRVERAIQYIRTNFLCAREYTCLEDLNAQLQDWLDGTARSRTWINDSNRLVGDVFKEDEKLLPLPKDSFEVYEEKSVRSTRQAFIQFDTNRYTVPAKAASRPLSVRATHNRILVYDRGEKICEHERSWSKKQKISDPSHLESVAKASKASSQRHSRYILSSHLGEELSHDLYTSWALLGESLTNCSRRFLELLSRYGIEDVTEATRQAKKAGTLRVESIAYILQKNNDPTLETKEISGFLRKELAEFQTESHELSNYDNHTKES